jgi:methionyl-tRNA formyltransferase
MESMPRIVFYGTPDFAVPSLEALVGHGFPVAGVVTAPDRPSGRGLQLVEPAIKKSATKLGVPVLQPTNLKSEDFFQDLQYLKPDLQVVVAFRMLPRRVWDLPRLGTFNLHASLLPQFRGAAPINHAILAGVTKTGVTTFLIDDQIDTGSLLLQEEVLIDPDENAGMLYERLKKKGAKLVIRTASDLASGNLKSKPQHTMCNADVTLLPAPKISRKDLELDWHQPVDLVYNRIRAFSPVPGIMIDLPTKDGGKLQVKIRSARKNVFDDTDPVIEPGTLIFDGKKHLGIAAKGGFIEFLELQPTGKTTMDIHSFLNGFGAKLHQNP